MTCPAPPKTLDELRRLLLTRGGEQYTGEPVSHLAHALQAAWLAQRAGAPQPLVVAALLHDIGHLASGLSGTPSAAGIDDCHEAVGAALLAHWFGPEVCEPVRLHVAAKRALAAEPVYWRALSEDSRRSLGLQGGVLDAAQRADFLGRPFAHEALDLRRWDDAAKKDREPLMLEAVWPVVEAVAAQTVRVRASGGLAAK